MNRRHTLGFEITPRARRADELVPKILNRSRAFKVALAAGDAAQVSKVSREAWDLLSNLFEILRNEEDQGRLDHPYMRLDTGYAVTGLTQVEMAQMISDQRIDRNHAGFGPLSLRDCLNKVAHFDTAYATFRVDGRGAHYLILGGVYRRQPWLAEILVSKLCTSSRTAVKALRVS